MPVRPVGDRILIKQTVQQEEVHRSGIVLATDGPKKFPMGEVRAVGDKVTEIKVGDVVVFEGWNGEPVSEEMGGEEHLMILKVDRIIATYEK